MTQIEQELIYLEYSKNMDVLIEVSEEALKKFFNIKFNIENVL